MKKTFKVGSRTDVSKLAGAIANCIREGKELELQSIGAGALNQAVKAVAIAKGYLAPAGIKIMPDPAFEDLDIDGTVMTAIKMEVRVI